MPPQLPRLIGYGAYGLCFDKKLGAANGPNKPNFFEFLRNPEENWPINHVKVMCFYNATAEVENERAIQLYKPDHSINPAFLNNLSDLVDAAIDPVPNRHKDFKVQVCLFSYHGVADVDLIPKDNPFFFDFSPTQGSQRKRLRKFFNPQVGTQTRARQLELVDMIGRKLAGKPNVIWELCNEARIDGQQPPPPPLPDRNPTQEEDNRNLVAWLQQMETALKSAAGGDIHITTSTGLPTQNEAVTCRQVPTTLFDFHFGQWCEGIPGGFEVGIDSAVDRAASYKPGEPLTINDDGARDAGDSNFPIEKRRTGANVKRWATKAFSRGLNFITKQPYPSKETWYIPALNGLRDANEAVPE